MDSNSLRELLVSSRTLDTFPGDVMRGILQSVSRGEVQGHSVSERGGVGLTTEEDRTQHLNTRNWDLLMIPILARRKKILF